MSQDWHAPDCDLFLRHRNPGATQDLTIPVHLVCNTPDDVLLRNIATNARARPKWLAVRRSHSRAAIICGSGPSLADSINEVCQLKSAGGLIFALNGAARFLAGAGVMPDFQVICDARPETADLIGPARRHLFASQCDPALFEAVPGARLWHLWIGEEMNQALPSYEGSYVLIGGTSSVGNVATCLAYALGFRDLHCFGYDSSHKGAASHAFEQKLNAGDPLTRVTYRGVDYLISFTMRSQVDTFFEYGSALEDAGARITMHGDGLLPRMWRDGKRPADAEREAAKYRTMWMQPEYRRSSPGEERLPEILGALKSKPGAHVIDFGCGPGRAAGAMQDVGHRVTAVDFASNCLDPDIRVPFVEACLWDLPASLTGDAGICCDVMEHIPPDKVDDVLASISRAVPACAFTISSRVDRMGWLIGERLHLTIHPPEWWQTKLGEHWPVVERIGDELYLARKEQLEWPRSPVVSTSTGFCLAPAL